MRVASVLVAVLVGSPCVSMMVGCGSSSPESIPGAIDEQAEPLGFLEQCDAIAGDQYVLGRGNLTTPSFYDHAGCARAYIEDLFFYNPAFYERNTQFTDVWWIAPLPNNQADCQRAEVQLYVWVFDPFGGPSIALGSRSSRGVWMNYPMPGYPRCLNLGVSVVGNSSGPPDPLGPLPGLSYRYAASARQGFPDGTYVTKEMLIRQQ